MTDLIFPIESTLYIKKGIDKIIKHEDRKLWFPTIFLDGEKDENPNDIFIIQQAAITRKSRNPGRKTKQKNNDENKYRIFVETFEWYDKKEFLDRLKIFAEACKKKHITIFGMIYVHIGYYDKKLRCNKTAETQKIVIKKGKIVPSRIRITARQCQNVMHKDNREYKIEDLYEPPPNGTSNRAETDENLFDYNDDGYRELEITNSKYQDDEENYQAALANIKKIPKNKKALKNKTKTTKNKTKQTKKVVEKQQEVAQGDDDDFYNPDEDNYFRDTSNTDADSDALLNDIMDWVNKN